MEEEFWQLLYRFFTNPLAMAWLGFFVGVLVTLKFRKEV